MVSAPLKVITPDAVLEIAPALPVVVESGVRAALAVKFASPSKIRFP